MHLLMNVLSNTNKSWYLKKNILEYIPKIKIVLEKGEEGWKNLQC